MIESAVVIVHMQPFMTFSLKEREESLLSSQEKVLEHCSMNDYPALLIEWPNSEKTVKRIKDAYEKVPRRELVERADTDGLSYSGADEILREWNVKSLLMIGMWASGCVYATSKGAKNKCYDIILPLDCVEDKSATDYECILKMYRDNLGAKVFYHHSKALAYMDALRKVNQ